MVKCSGAKITKWGWKVGTKIEMEHTKSKKRAKKIAGDHLCEFGDAYYRELIKIEDKLGKKLRK
jgi:hypothetical protein